MSHFIEHAERELALYGSEGLYGEDTGKAVMELVRIFDGQHHSGGSAMVVSQIFMKLAGYGILTPITDEPDQWVDHGAGMFQHKRLSSVFKDHSGVYDIDGIIFREPDGATYTSKDSRVPVEFPYTQVRKIVDVDEGGKPVKNEIHPAPGEFTPAEIAQDNILHFFHYSHLPPTLQATSSRFCGMARFIVDTLPRNPERTVALRKLLEAKDAAVRANVGPKIRRDDHGTPIEHEIGEVHSPRNDPDKPLTFDD